MLSMLQNGQTIDVHKKKLLRETKVLLQQHIAIKAIEWVIQQSFMLTETDSLDLFGIQSETLQRLPVLIF